MSKFFDKDNKAIPFVCGMLMVVVVVPVASSIGELCCQWIEDMKAIAIEKTSKRNIRISRLQKKLEEEETPTSSNAIGFEIPEAEEVYGDYCKNKTKRKIGF